jgi:hypothetical protein
MKPLLQRTAFVVAVIASQVLSALPLLGWA